MCGIAGRFNFHSRAPVAASTIQGMCDLLAHRGPDGQGVFVDGHVGLGHRRLAVIDLSANGRQPMSTPDGKLWITFNGEIYNHLALRADLEKRGHRFRSRTDTEVVMAAYRQWGQASLERLRGMFAFAIWDRGAQTLFLARDRLGKKPLCYWLDNDGLAFASEPKAFLADPAFEPAPNLEAISHYLSYQYVPSPSSAFANVRKLPPAHCMVVSTGRIRTERYWELRYTPKRVISEDEACEELLTRLTESVRLRLASEVPLGAFLSGGVDSSAIVALMAAQGGRVKTFSIGFDEKEYDELPYARAIVRRYATDHHEFVVRPDARDMFEKLVWHYNEPFADPSAIPTYYLSALARRHVTVALNGDAGDENFAGYSRYVVARGVTGACQRLPLKARLTARSLGATIRSRGTHVWLSRLRQWTERLAMSAQERYTCGMMQFPPSLKAQLCTPEFIRATGRDSRHILLDEFHRTDARHAVDMLLHADVSRYLPDALLVKVDIASMAHGLEARSPFLDHEFMEFAATLPADFKLRGSITKYIFKRAVRPLLPDHVVDRPKRGFSVPLDHWFRHELREMAHGLLLDRKTIERGYFQPFVIKRMLDEHVRGMHNWADQLWNLVMLELWHRTFGVSAPGTWSPSLPVATAPETVAPPA
jgi:asparagine synthase (glutamine-hydrolysing)